MVLWMEIKHGAYNSLIVLYSQVQLWANLSLYSDNSSYLSALMFPLFMFREIWLPCKYRKDIGINPKDTLYAVFYDAFTIFEMICSKYLLCCVRVLL